MTLEESQEWQIDGRDRGDGYPAISSPRVHICISRRAIAASAREGKAGGRGDEDGDENGEKNEAEGKWSDARGSRIRREQGERGEKIKRNWRRLRMAER